MTTTDIAFLVAFGCMLALLLAVSKVTRALLWDTIRHPFTKSRIEFRDGMVAIRHDGPVR